MSTCDTGQFDYARRTAELAAAWAPRYLVTVRAERFVVSLDWLGRPQILWDAARSRPAERGHQLSGGMAPRQGGSGRASRGAVYCGCPDGRERPVDPKRLGLTWLTQDELDWHWNSSLCGTCGTVKARSELVPVAIGPEPVVRTKDHSCQQLRASLSRCRACHSAAVSEGMMARWRRR